MGIILSCYIGIMRNRMEAAIVYGGYIELIDRVGKNDFPLLLAASYRRHIQGLGLRVPQSTMGYYSSKFPIRTLLRVD